jgi:hypothetical protein
MRTVPFAFLLALSSSIALAQEIRVFPDLQRIDPYGKVITADRGSRINHEILSPALPRNTSSSFHIAVEAPQGVPYWLYIGLNPENAIPFTLYREIFEKNDKGEWVPDKLVKLELPYNGLVPDKNIPGQTTEVFLLDVQIPRDAVVRRMKIEPQMWIPDRWITYPMEARIVPAQLLTQVKKHGEIHPVDSPADTTYRNVFNEVFCNGTERNGPEPALSIRSLILRNARRDAALAAPLFRPMIGTLLGHPEAPDWCKTTPVINGPEQSLRLRNRILRE